MKLSKFLSAAALLSSAGLASAQVTPVGPFTGPYTESFETQNPACPPCFFTCVPGRIFNGTADVCDSSGGANMNVTSGWSFFCTIFPNSGGELCASAGGPAKITFDAPVTAFGGFFGTNSGTDGAVVTFYDAGNSVIGTQPLTTNGCTWTWNGWQSTTPIAAVLITGNNPFGGGYIMMDDLEYSLQGQTLGACCKPDGTCLATSQAGCSSAGGVYRGDNTVCANANCPAGGACCLAQGACSIRTAGACAAQSGIYRGDNTTCANANCPGGFHIDCTIPGTFTDISATGTSLTDGDDSVVGFTSTVTNALVTNPNLFACTNGFISDNSTYNNWTNATLPLAAVGFAMFPNWDDLYADPASVPPGSIRAQSVVESGVPVQIIQWDNVRTYAAGPGGPTGKFQVKIFGAGGPAAAQFLYQGMSWDGNGDSSTVGVQWSAGNAFQKSYNEAGSIADNSVCSIVANATAAVCYANCDSSTTAPCLNVLDFGCFLNKFAAGDTYANCDNSTTAPVLNVLDFGCFLNKFAAGCSSC